MPMLDYSSAGLAMTEGFEGRMLTAYQDVVGVWTIGYGHTGPDVMTGLTITQAQAVILLKADIASAVTCINHAVKVPLTQNQFDALVDFAFNVGNGALLGSTLLKLLNQKNYTGAQAEFAKWNKAGGKPVAGLTKRRAAEAKLFGTVSVATNPA